MALEAGTYLNSLVTTNPVDATDQVASLGGHVRLIKSTLVNTFPNITGKVSATHQEINYLGGVSANLQTQIDAKAAKGANSDITSLAGLTTPLSVAQGGTGRATITSNSLVVGNGTTAVALLAPGTSSQVVMSDGGTWAARTLPAPADSGLGVNQTWQDKTSSRSINTVYQNTTGRCIFIAIRCTGDGILLMDSSNPPTAGMSQFAGDYNAPLNVYTHHTIIPANHYYKLVNTNSLSIVQWWEML